MAGVRRGSACRRGADEAVTSTLALPGAVLATRESSGSPWRTGAERDPADPIWRLRTGDPATRRRGHSATTRFDAPIAVGATLADPAFCGAAAVRRALCVGALQHGFGGGTLAALGTAALLLHLDWLIRWCADRGVHRFSLLRPVDLRDFASGLRAGAVLGVVDLDARLAALPDAELAGVLGDVGDPLRVADAAALARLLGVTTASLRGAPAILPRALARRLGQGDPAEADPHDGGDASVSLHTTAAHLEVWSRLRHATERGWIVDGLGFMPFGPHHSARAVVSRLGGVAGRTPTLRPDVFLGLLSAAARVVLLQGPAVIASVGCAAGGGDVDRTAVERDVRHLVAAVAVLVGGISGRRGGEVAGIRRGALLEGPCGPELTTPIGKSGGAVDRVPVPALVAVGVRAVESLALSERDAAECWLLRIVLPWGRVIEINPAGDLASFAAAEGLGVDAGRLASHQLRRGMSLLWEYGYRAGTPAGLARALRHAVVAAGVTYVTEAEPGRVAALRDDMAAATRVSVSAIGPGRRARLLCLRERLRDPDHPLGQPPGADRYGGHPLSLLEAWASGLDASARCGPAPLPLEVRIGSQAVVAGDGAPLLPAVRAHAAALARLGVLP